MALPRWRSKPSEEGSSRQVLAVFLAGAVGTINHCIEPKSNKQAQKYVVQRAAGTEPNNPNVPLQYSPLLPGLVPACSPSKQPEAPAAPRLCAAAGCLHLDLSVAARNAIFFIPIYKFPGILSTTLTLATLLRAGGSFYQDKHLT